MFDNNEFKIALLKRDKNYKDIAEVLGISVATLYRKSNGSSDFYRDEIQEICDFLNLTLEEKENIFFAQ